MQYLMVEIKLNEKSLEKALNKVDNNNSIKSKDESQGFDMPKEEEIGFHKGCLNTLVNERNELVKMIQNVEVIMQMHLKRLDELGVKIQSKEEKK
jgi:hypothetical protein